MLAVLFKRVLPAALVAAGAALPVAVQSQMRGGPPAGIPTGGPPNGFPGGIPGGPPAGLPASPGVPAHGPPPWAARPQGEGVPAAAKAQSAGQGKLSKAERDRAADRIRNSPGIFELDRNGALAIRGEVLVTGLDTRQLARLQQNGFSVLRRDDMTALGMPLAVVSRDGLDTTRAIRILRRIAPEGSYAPNHVLFQSGARLDSRVRINGKQAAGQAPNSVATVGLVDTGVAANVDANPRVRLLRHNFARGESLPRQHGTAVAALLARNPGHVTIYAADIFGSDPRGGTSELLIRALGWMAGARVPVLNVSMTGPANPIVGAVIAKLVALGFTVVAPVGNDGAAARPLYPASYPGVVAVSGAGPDGQLLPEASRVKRVDFVAPGIAAVADVSGRETQVRGTSFAAPIVSRLLANQVHSPNPVAARRAIQGLASQARRPKADRAWYGHGLVGIGGP